MITKLEEQILLTVLKFKGKAYGINIYQHLEDITGSKVAIGVIYFALDRLNKRGLLSSYKGEPTAVRGGMSKKYYKVTKTAISELMESKKVSDMLWEDFSEFTASAD
jgi:DNA-binding PadR family transcriptional regulator